MLLIHGFVILRISFPGPSQHYVNKPVQNHGASYHGIFAIIFGINDESFETVFKAYRNRNFMVT